MTIADVVPARQGPLGNAWRVERDGRTATLWHHGTAMLTWNPDPEALRSTARQLSELADLIGER